MYLLGIQMAIAPVYLKPLCQNLSSWCLAIVVWLFLMMPQVFRQFVIVVFSDHTHLLFLM